MYGAIERIRIVKDRNGKSKSYAFIVYERERDMKGKSCYSNLVTTLIRSRVQGR